VHSAGMQRAVPPNWRSEACKVRNVTYQTIAKMLAPARTGQQETAGLVRPGRLFLREKPVLRRGQRHHRKPSLPQ
jgi:hypothetical protein